MTAKSSQSARVARRSRFGSRIALPLGIAAVCATLCSGCQQNSATEFHEYSGNGKSQEHLVANDDAKPDESKAQQQVLANKTSAQVQPPAANPDKKPADATKPQESATPVATQKVPQTANEVADAPVVAPKPLPANSATQPNPFGAAQATIDTPSAPRKPKVLITERQFQTAGPEGAIRVSYDDIDLLKVLNMEPVTSDALAMMPDWLKGLEGKRVRLRGFMFPANSQTGLAGFSLARDNQICCFVRKPKVYDVFPVKLRDGVTTDYIANRPIDVVGIFHFLPDPEYWPIDGMYFIEDATVVDKR